MPKKKAAGESVADTQRHGEKESYEAEAVFRCRGNDIIPLAVNDFLEENHARKLE